MEDLKEVLKGEIEGFRKKGHKFINGEMTMMEFKHASGGFGVYAHRAGTEFMVRLRIPSGVTDVYELKKVYELGKKYNVSKIHFTTRQAIQLHGMNIDDVCDLMEEALEYNIYTRGSGGDFPRNVALSPLAGVNTEEPFDPTPYALSVGNYFLERIYKYKLPRKLKVSFSSSNSDGAHCTVQDIGFLAVDNKGEKAFQIYMGGGLGQNPKLAIKYPELIDAKDVLYYIEAMVKFYMAEGNYENRARARVRYILDRLGEDEFVKKYKNYVEEEKAKGGMDLYIDSEKCMKKGNEIELSSNRIYKQKQSGLYSVYIHPIGGQLYLEDLRKLIELLDTMEDINIRLAMTEGIYVRNLTGIEAKKTIKFTEKISSKTKISQGISCIGAPICQMGLGNSQKLLNLIINFFDEKGFNKDVLPRIYISGCGNSCGIHQVASIGFKGRRKKVDGEMRECFSLFAGGSFAIDRAKIGKCYGEILQDEIPKFLYELALKLDELQISFDEYLEKDEQNFEKIIKKYLV